METKLWNRDPSNGFTSQFSLGGLPVFTNDLQDMQNNYTELFGNLSLLKGYSCILRGCEVDTLNTNSKTCSILPGIILLNDTVLYFSGGTFNYPFSIVKGGTETDERVFKDGGTKAVAISYNYSIRTVFNYGSLPSDPSLRDVMPVDLSNQEIYFDPFTGQKATLILSNLAKGYKEIKSIASSMVVSKTETDNNIVGTSLNAIYNGKQGRWSYLGYSSYINAGSFDIKNYDGTGTAGMLRGSDQISLGKNNIPAHLHTAGDLTISKSGGHEHYIHNGGNAQSGGGAGAGMAPNNTGFNDSNFRTNIDDPNFDGSHTHTITGKTGDGSDDGLKVKPDTIDVSGKGLPCYILAWEGYQYINSFYNFNASTYTPYLNM